MLKKMSKKELRMQTRYEVSRLSKNYIPAAYEKLIPIIAQQIESKEKDNNSLELLDAGAYLKRNNQ